MEIKVEPLVGLERDLKANPVQYSTNAGDFKVMYLFYGLANSNWYS